MTSPIHKKVLVDCNAATAFDIFVLHLDRWWPVREHSVSGVKNQVPLAVHIDAQPGGAIAETKFDGTATVWGNVIEILPGERFTATWHPGHGPKMATKLDVVFQDAPLDQCSVSLTHGGWRVWGAEAPKRRDMYLSGWDYLLGKCYVESVADLLA